MKKNILTLLLAVLVCSTKAQIVLLEEDKDVYIFQDYSFYKSNNNNDEPVSTIAYMDDHWAVVHVSYDRGFFTTINAYYNGERVANFGNAAFSSCRHNTIGTGNFYFTYKGRLYTNCNGGLNGKALFHEIDSVSGKVKNIYPDDVLKQAYQQFDSKGQPAFNSGRAEVEIVKTSVPHQFIIYNSKVFSWDKKQGPKPFFLYDLSTGTYQKFEAPPFNRLIDVFDGEHFFFANVEDDEYGNYYYFNSKNKTGYTINGIGKKDIKKRPYKIYQSDEHFYIDINNYYYEITNGEAVKKTYDDIRTVVKRESNKDSLLFWRKEYGKKHSIGYPTDLNKQKLKNYPSLYGKGDGLNLPFYVYGIAAGGGKAILFADTAIRSGYYTATGQKGAATDLKNANNKIIQAKIDEKRHAVEGAHNSIITAVNGFADCIKRGIDCSSVQPYNRKLYDNYLLMAREYIAILEKYSSLLDPGFISGEKNSIEKAKQEMRTNPGIKAAMGW